VSILGFHHSEESKKKMSIGQKKRFREETVWNKGKKLSKESRKKMSEARMGKPPWNKGRTGVYSEASKKKMSEAQQNRSEETRKKMSEAQKGKPSAFKGKKHSEESKKKMSKFQKGRLAGKKHPMYGKHHTEEAKRRNAKAHKGKRHSEETKKKLSRIVTGRKHTEETRKKMSRVQKGSKKHNAESRRKISEAGKGRKVSAETRKKMSEAMKGKFDGAKHPMYGKHLSEAAKRKVSEFQNRPENIQKNRERRSKIVIPFKDSKPELLTQSILKKHNISFKKHHNFKLSGSYHQADIVIGPNHVIEVFGDYWHFNPKKYDGESIKKVRRKQIKVKEVWKYDKYVIDGMKEQGYKVLVIWESELKNELENTTQKILKFIKN